LLDGEEGSHLTSASNLSDTVLPSTPESPGEMFVSPLGSAGPSRRVAGKASPRLSGVSRLMKTPKQTKRQSADLSGLMGVKQLMRTPKVQKSPSLGGVKKLVATPKDVAGMPELDGIRNLVKTPKPRKSTELMGVKQLLKTPKAQKSPALDGVKKLVRTPKDVALSPKLDGVRKLVKTPKAQKSPRLAGMKRLLKTPTTKKSPQLAGLKTLMRTPKQQQSPVLAGVRQLVKTPKSGPKSPDFVGMSEMLASPQTSGSVFLERSSQKSAPKKKRGKEVTSDVSAVPSPKTLETRGRKITKKTTERPEVEAESLSVRRRGAGKSKSASEDHTAVSKKLKSSKPVADAEVAKSHNEVKQASVVISALSPKGSTSRKGKSRGRSEDASAASTKAVAASEETDVAVSKEKVTKATSTPVAKTRSKRQLVQNEPRTDEDSMHIVQQVGSKRSHAGGKAIEKSKSGVPEVIVDVSFSPKMPMKSSARGTKRSKKTADASVLSAGTSMDQTVATRRNVVKTPEVAAAKKSTRNRTVTIVGPSPRHLRDSGKASKPTTSVAAEMVMAADGTAKTGGRKKTQQNVVTEDDVSIPQKVGSKNSRAARKPKNRVVIDQADSSENVEVHVAGQLKGSRGTKRVASPVSSNNKASGRGRRQAVVTESAENVTVQQKGQKSPAAVTVRGGRAGKRQFVTDEPQPVPESTKLKTPSKSQKRTQNADQRGNPVTSEQLQSAKSPVSTRRGKREITVKESLPAAENVKMQEKGQKQPEAAAVAGRRRGKHDESLEVVEVKVPSRSQKRPQAVEPVEAPVSKSRKQHAEESLLVEQPIKRATKTKQRGKSSTSDLAEPIVQPDKVKTGAKSPVKKSARKKVDKKLSIEVGENVANTSKKTGGRNAKKLKETDNLLKLKASEKKKEDAKVVVEIEKKVIVSPRATRSKRTKR